MWVDREVLDTIKSKYQLVCELALVEYDTCWDNLIEILHEFKDAVFEHDERILILHHDTDYYCENQGIGNSIYNLFKILSELNIPCDKIIFLTNHYGIREEITQASRLIANDADPCVIYTSLWYDFPDKKTISSISEIDSVPITQLYHCLNGKQRMHRLFLLCALNESNLLDQGIISYHFCS